MKARVSARAWKQPNMEDHQSLQLQDTQIASQQLVADAMRLVSEAIALLRKAEELERFQRMEDETASSERPLSSDDALYL
jgi:hypothetical protein